MYGSGFSDNYRQQPQGSCTNRRVSQGRPGLQPYLQHWSGNAVQTGLTLTASHCMRLGGLGRLTIASPGISIEPKLKKPQALRQQNSAPLNNIGVRGLIPQTVENPIITFHSLKT